MNKGIRLIKRMMALLLVLILSIESLGAVVSDNDGSAFITKAEFDSLKNNFQSEIEQYNTSIDSKIDGAIAAYLAGLTLSTAYQYSGNNSLLFYPLTYEKQDKIMKRIIDNGGVYNEALMKFGVDLWLMSERADAGTMHFVRRPSGKAINGYIGNWETSNSCLIKGRYDVTRMDITGMTYISYTRGNENQGPNYSVIKGCLYLDYTNAVRQEKWEAALYDQTRIHESSSTSNWRKARDNTLYLTAYGDSINYSGGYVTANYWGKGENPYNTVDTMMSRLDKVNAANERNLNFQQTQSGTAWVWVSSFDYYDTINTWKDSSSDGTSRISIVAQGNKDAVLDSEKPGLNFVYSSKHRQPYIASEASRFTQHYWTYEAAGDVTQTDYRPGGHIYLIDFGPMLRLPSVETNNAKKNLFYNDKLIAQNNFNGTYVKTNMHGGLPIFRISENRTFANNGIVTLNVSKGRMASGTEVYLFISNKEILGDNKDDIINNSANELFKFNGAKYKEVVFDADTDYKFDFDGELKLGDILYVKFGWTVSDNDETIVINSVPQIALNS